MRSGRAQRTQNNSFINSGLTHSGCLARLLLCCLWADHSQRLQTAIPKETFMNTRISTKLAALAIALMMNGILFGGVAYLFDTQAHRHSLVALIALAKQIATFQALI
jgi:hypothetical protein